MSFATRPNPSVNTDRLQAAQLRRPATSNIKLAIHMTPHILLEKLKALLQSMPPLEGRGQYSNEQYSWLGQANALMHEWDEIKSIPFKSAVNGMLHNLNRSGNFGVVVAFIHDVIARVENSLPQEADQVFGPGAAYDFFRALNDLVSTAKTQLWVVDPYLDAEVFDGYMQALNPGISARLLTAKYLNNVRVAAEKYQAQFGSAIEIRSSNDIHDRVIFVDHDQCWVLGASIKDAALKKPTYLAPVSTDVAIEKRKLYEAIWAAGTPI